MHSGNERGVGFFSHTDRRDAQPIPCLQAIGLGNALLVDPHFPAQDAIDVALGHALQLPEEEIIDALTGAFLVDFDPSDGFFAQTVHF